MQAATLKELFENETFAVEVLKNHRMNEGIECKKCGCHKHYWLAPKQQFQCSSCRFRTTLRSGTLLEGSKLPIRYLFIAIYLLSRDGHKLTPEQLQEATGHRYYVPIGHYLRKLKNYLRTINTDQQGPLVYDNLVHLYLKQTG